MARWRKQLLFRRALVLRMRSRWSLAASYRSSGRMRRAGLGEGVPPGNYGNCGYPNSGETAREENERLTESLRNKVTAIKSVSI